MEDVRVAKKHMEDTRYNYKVKKKKKTLSTMHKHMFVSGRGPTITKPLSVIHKGDLNHFCTADNTKFYNKPINQFLFSF